MAALFTIPVPALNQHAPGTITCTSPAPLVYLLSISAPPDNRLTTATCTALLTALDTIEFSHPPGVVLTTSALPKFYSNGLDLEHALGTPTFLPQQLYRLFHRLLTYPMPTIAVLNGHAFAGGLMLAMHHDYRIMNPAKGFACINELDFGVPLKPAMSSIFRIKTVPETYRKLVLEAHRFDGKAALAAGFVDGLGGVEEAVKFVEERKLTEKGKTGIYGLMKAEMYRESVDFLSEKGHYREEERVLGMLDADAERKEEGAKRIGAKL
ncbi:ClpP/crotonase-like domain-containing protein [Podospora aff. communis PSN243]|uniref:ClpP/crotonase-like domain-containing protein n=1 Tax=Podospora aff. communis PSN243 TaxID=3040156 RepID=A0AAV9GWK1_9PEZI|nr:ClpP/crotonase-like domain-containing protein [Podospora aff. communis PSN243]